MHPVLLSDTVHTDSFTANSDNINNFINVLYSTRKGVR